MWPFEKRRTLQEELDSINLVVDSSSEQTQLASLDLLDCKRRSAWLAASLRREVENGGFAQYFWHTESEVLHSAMKDALHKIGAVDHLTFFVSAHAMLCPYFLEMRTWQGEDDRFAKYKPFLRESGLYERLQALDCRFYDCRPTMDSILARFLRVRHDTRE